MSELVTILDDGLPGTVIVASQGAPDVIIGAPPAPGVITDGPDTPTLTVVVAGGPKGDPGPRGDSADAVGLVQTHVDSPLPHPAYDDMVDLSLIFENGLV